jgi:lysophospholipase L1-like esterase
MFDRLIQRNIQMADPQDLPIPVHADPLQYPLPHLAEGLASKGPVKIVAIGSSSTAGEGGIAPYPERLQEMLRQTYGNFQIDVINQGVGGQEAPDELARMQAVINEKPALTIWQIGTNAVWKGQDLDQVDMAVKAGLNLLKKEPMDVILMDLQYAPAILTDNRIGPTRRMLSLILDAAIAANVSVFRRFDMMRKIVEIEQRSFDALIDPGDNTRLHESDMISGRIGYELCRAIAVAATVASPDAAPPGGLIF